jgi:probable HAF family extracellular repeat protein
MQNQFRPGSSANLCAHLAAMLLVSCLLASGGTAQTRYQIIHLPTADGYNSAAFGLNDSGNVIGYSYQDTIAIGFFYNYSADSMNDLGSFGGQATVATAVDNDNQVVGYSADNNGLRVAFLYTADKGLTPLGTLPGGSNSEAFSINSSAEGVGDSETQGDSHRPVIFTNETAQDLGIETTVSSLLQTAYGINDSGQIVGRYQNTDGVTHAFLYASGQLTDLGTLGGANSEALAINVNGLIVGDSQITGGTIHAFVFNKGSMQDLGTLPGFANASFARGVNNTGQVVGESDSDNQKRAFVYSNGQMSDLTQAAVNMRQAGFSALDVANGINNQGWIAGFGTTLDGRLAGFLAIPVGVTSDPPGGVDAPVFTSGDVNSAAWTGGWFAPLGLWSLPLAGGALYWSGQHWHNWPKAPWHTPPQKPHWQPPSKGHGLWPTPRPRPNPKGTSTQTPNPRGTPAQWPTPHGSATPVFSPRPRPTPTPNPGMTPRPPWLNPSATPPYAGPTGTPRQVALASPTPIHLPTPRPTPTPSQLLQAHPSREFYDLSHPNNPYASPTVTKNATPGATPKPSEVVKNTNDGTRHQTVESQEATKAHAMPTPAPPEGTIHSGTAGKPLVKENIRTRTENRTEHHTTGKTGSTGGGHTTTTNRPKPPTNKPAPAKPKPTPKKK